MAITDWPVQERPRERLLAFGAASLADAELLAILLRTGIKGKSAVDLARQLLGRFGSVGGLLDAGSTNLAETPGLGTAKLAQLQAALELAVPRPGVSARFVDPASSRPPTEPKRPRSWRARSTALFPLMPVRSKIASSSASASEAAPKASRRSRGRS